MISIQQNMTNLIHRSQEAGKSVQEAVLVIPSLAVKLTGEVLVNTKDFIIAFKNVSWLFIIVVIKQVVSLVSF